MRVVILSSMYPRASDPTSGIFIHNHVRCLREKGCEVVIISPEPVPVIPRRGFSSWQQLRRLKHEDEIEGVKVIYPRYFIPPRQVFMESYPSGYYCPITRIVRRVIKSFRPEIMHAHRATPDGFMGLMLRDRFGLPLLVSLRGSDINVRPFLNKGSYRMTKKVISEADRIAAVSEALRAKAETIGSPKLEISVLYNGCDIDKFAFDSVVRSSIRKKLGIPGQSLVFIFVGHIIRKKGVFDLVQAFGSFNRKQLDSYLVILGDGKEKKILVREISKNEMHRKILIVGTRRHDEIPAWLSMADILVLPSMSEGLPNVILEAMACERAVISTTVGGIPEVIEDGKSGILVAPKNHIALAEAMEKLARDRELRHKVGNAGRAIVIEKFSQDKNIRMLLRLYESMLGEKPTYARFG
jgi:teichuronic acid biosynthesis glycosyltransferase TuaC